MWHFFVNGEYGWGISKVNQSTLLFIERVDLQHIIDVFLSIAGLFRIVLVSNNKSREIFVK